MREGLLIMSSKVLLALLGSPNKSGSSDSHGSPLGDEEIKLTKEVYNWTYGPFEVPESVYEYFREDDIQRAQKRQNWLEILSEHPKSESFISQYKSLDCSSIEFPNFEIGSKLATRAASGKDKVAICGYHGWHDWYLATNLRSKNNLNEHLLPGLKTGGVHKKLKDTIYPFRYNDFNGLKKLVKKHQEIGIIKMEVIRNEPPKNNFLKKVRELANKNNIVLIFDECTSGFRECLGGIQKKYGVDPDIMMLGKALGNGYAITAVLGKKKIMNSISKTFISSTFWTEGIGPTAAIETLKIMENKKSWKYITSLGNYVRKKWLDIAKKNKVKIKVQGIPSLSSFTFLSKNHQAYKTYVTQEMLKKGFLATTTIYVSMSHTKQILNKYLKILEKIFLIISKCEKDDDIHRYLDTEVSETDFARLN